jgi:hypothetical protein
LRIAKWFLDRAQNFFGGERLKMELSRVEETSLINRTEKIGLVDASVCRSTEKPGVWINLLLQTCFLPTA